MEQRLIDLEMKMSHLENFVDELNSVIIDQYKLLESQKKEIEKLKQIVKERDNNEEINNEPPPHY